MGVPSRKQIEEGHGFAHMDREGNRFYIADSFRAPLLEFTVVRNKGEVRRAHAFLDSGAITNLHRWLGDWLDDITEDE